VPAGQYFSVAEGGSSYDIQYQTNLVLYGSGVSWGTNQRDIYLNQFNGDYEARFVLKWAATDGSGESRDLDLFTDFQISDRFVCSVGYYLPNCWGVHSNFEGQNAN